jgi:ribosomal protein S18 acetylase RimI-like enzyme
MYDIKAYGQLNDIQKKDIVGIFLEGFGHMMTFSKDIRELEELFFTAFHSSYIYACLENDKVLGILGIATNRIRPIKIDLDHSVSIYGKWRGAIICRQMNLIFQRQVIKKSTDLYIDVLTTTKNARGKGVATGLLEFAFSLPEYKECYIEVLSKNANARRLYEKCGFTTYKKKLFSFITLMGHGYPIMMKRMNAGL